MFLTKKLYLIQAFSLMHVSKCMMKIFARCFAHGEK